MTPLVSRLLVAIALLPVVIGVVYLGGWWLFALTLVAGLIALHELYRMARERRPLVIAGYGGFALTLLGLQLGGLPWMLGGILATLFLSFVFYGLSDIRASATTSFGITLLGVVWVGAGLGLLLLVRDIPDYGFWAVIAVMFTVFAADTAAFFVGRTLGQTPTGAGDLAGEDLGGAGRRGAGCDGGGVPHPLQGSRRVPDDPGDAPARRGGRARRRVRRSLRVRGEA